MGCAVRIGCPRCGEEFDLRDAEVLERLTDQQALYLAAIRGLVRPVGYVAGKVVFVVVEEEMERVMEAVH